MKWIAVFKEKTGERASFQKVGDTLQIQANAPIVINATGEKLNGVVNVTINQLTSVLKSLMSSCQHGVKESAVMKSEESKEIKECIKELDACYEKLYKCFCEGKFCTECNLGVPYDGCVLCILQDSIEILKEKSDELL